MLHFFQHNLVQKILYLNIKSNVPKYIPKVKFWQSFCKFCNPKLGTPQQFCNTITVNMKDWTSRLSKWWWWFEIFFGLHEWPLLKKKKVGYFKRLGPFKRCYNLQLVNIFCDHFMQSFVASCSCTLRLNQCIKKISQWRRQFISRES